MGMLSLVGSAPLSPLRHCGRISPTGTRSPSKGCALMRPLGIESTITPPGFCRPGPSRHAVTPIKCACRRIPPLLRLWGVSMSRPRQGSVVLAVCLAISGANRDRPKSRLNKCAKPSSVGVEFSRGGNSRTDLSKSYRRRWSGALPRFPPCAAQCRRAGRGSANPVALNILRTVPPQSTYVVALQTMVFSIAQPAQGLQLLRRNVRMARGIAKTRSAAAVCGATLSATATIRIRSSRSSPCTKHIAPTCQSARLRCARPGLLAGIAE